jgi:hypothetical protein
MHLPPWLYGRGSSATGRGRAREVSADTLGPAGVDWHGRLSVAGNRIRSYTASGLDARGGTGSSRPGSRKSP